MAKSFKQTATAQAPVYNKLLGNEDNTQLAGQMVVDMQGQVHEEQQVQQVQDAQEVQPSESMQTQGKKGERLPRINMAFSPANHEYITVMARLKGVTMTQYVNSLIDAEREANSELYDKARELLGL